MHNARSPGIRPAHHRKRVVFRPVVNEDIRNLDGELTLEGLHRLKEKAQ